jgi:hypothetical protein
MIRSNIIYFINGILFSIYILLFINAITRIVDYNVNAIIDYSFTILICGVIGLSLVSMIKFHRGDKRKIALISSGLGIIVIVTLIVSFILFASTLNEYF